MGKSREVVIYRLVSEGTVEEMIFLRQVYKQVKWWSLLVPTFYVF